MKSFWKIVGAYIVAALVCLLPGYVTSELAWEYFGWIIKPRVVVETFWLGIVGIISMTWAAKNLARSLGIRDAPQVHVQNRPVALGGMLADSARNVLSVGQKRPVQLDIPDEITIIQGSTVIPQVEIEDFLRGAWRRKRRKNSRGHACSRKHWVGETDMERDTYDALMDRLSAYGIVVGRGPRSSGRLIYPPAAALSILRQTGHNRRKLG